MLRQFRTRLTGSALSSRVAQWKQRGLIKSIQRGAITITNPATSNTATITAVDPNNSRLRFLGFINSSSDTGENLIRLTLTNATTITATSGITPDASGTVSYEIVEYWPGVIKSVQRGTITDTTGSDTATITTVNTSKTELDFLGQTSTGTGGLSFSNLVRMALTNATTVTQTSGTSGGANVGGYQAVEFY